MAGSAGKPSLLKVAAALAAALALAPRADALINPNFTPVHLVNQSDRILAAELGPVGDAGEIPVRVTACVKGTGPAGPPALDLTKTRRALADALRGRVGQTGRRPALLFTGQYREESPDGGEGEEPPPDDGAVGLLHLDGTWFRLFQRAGKGPWLLEAIDERMEGVWAGGTDMLLRAVRYILAEPNAYVPVRTGAAWAGHMKIAEVNGKVHGALAVDVAGDGRLVVHLLCEAGDRLLRWDAAKANLRDVTSEVTLASSSHAAAWADFDADGRLDLASANGRTVRFFRQSESGTFSGGERDAVALNAPCIGLSALDAGAAGRAGLIAGTATFPILVSPQASGGFEARTVPPPPNARVTFSPLGGARPCLVADFDGDHVVDILQPFASGAVFYQGTKPGEFAMRLPYLDVRTGDGRAGAFVGDYDADGRLDVFVAAEERCFVWQNRGGGAFEETLRLTGEAAYISKPGGIGGGTCDVNNDGRQDVLILYADRAPHLFFNRGWRSFGHSHLLDVAEQRLLPAADEGQQAGLVADLNGDGGQDMLIVLTNGEVWCFLRDVAGSPASCLRAGLGPRAASAGPVAVTGWRGKRCLGAWNVGPGTEAFFGLLEPGPCRLTWQFAGGEPREKKRIVLHKPVRLVLEP